MARVHGIKLRWCHAGILLITALLMLTYMVNYYKKSAPSEKSDFPVTIKPHNITLPPKKTIPKVIHQIWSDVIIPEEFVGHVQSIIKYNPHPEWEYYFWTLDLGRKFIARKFPKLLKLYDYAQTLGKAEILRMVVVYYYGGVYFDLDVFCLRPLDRFVDNHECALVAPIPELLIAYYRVTDRFEVNNAMFFCRPNHPFFKELIIRNEMLSAKCFLFNDPRSCNTIEYAPPLLAKYTATENTSIIPEVVDYYLFDSAYDQATMRSFEKVCTGKEYLQLERAKQFICDNWIRMGKDHREVDEDAYAYQSGYHTKFSHVTIDQKNNISNIVPYAKMYNPTMDKDFFRDLTLEH